MSILFLAFNISICAFFFYSIKQHNTDYVVYRNTPFFATQFTTVNWTEFKITGGLINAKKIQY